MPLALRLLDASARPSSLRSRSRHRGVTKHLRTGCYEAHIWARGRQIFLGAFESEAQAARAYDVCSVALKGARAPTNFGAAAYAAEAAAHARGGVSVDDVIEGLRGEARGCHAPPAGAASPAEPPTPARDAPLRPGSWRRPRVRAALTPDGAAAAALVAATPVLGFFESEGAAAAAHDTAAVLTWGLEAHTNRPICEYQHLLRARLFSASSLPLLCVRAPAVRLCCECVR